MPDDQRYIELQAWLRNDLGIAFDNIEPASGDASFRRYFRIQHQGENLIVMDAPPEHEDCVPFINISKAMEAMGLNVPRILQQNLEHGYLLLSDLGNVQYLEQLNRNTAPQLYRDALDALLRLQTSNTGLQLLPRYDHALLTREMELLREWYFEKNLKIKLSPAQHKLLDEVFELLAQSALAQPQTWVHRDYHSRNLMVVSKHNPGILDFQDAVYGPVTYDLVSLLKDCYIEWPREQVIEWVNGYHQRLLEREIINDVDTQQFIRWFDFMGVQRHLKVLGIFSRLHIRDHKSGYLKDIPRTLRYVTDTCRRYPELNSLGSLLTKTAGH